METECNEKFQAPRIHTERKATFSALYDAERLFRYVMPLLPDEEDVADVVRPRQTWIRINFAWGRYPPNTSVGGDAGWPAD